MLVEVNWLNIMLVVIVMVKFMMSLMINVISYCLMMVISSVVNCWNVSLVMNGHFMAHGFMENSFMVNWLLMIDFVMDRDFMTI